ncbi:plasmid mobilization protein [Carboxylicivirga sp. RSCT41]|uniref:plasmid mobilization protein n=1 Tax=Carboxylicivirga agarovorans TaxID=3417570 RepID=UPI003D3495B7
MKKRKSDKLVTFWVTEKELEQINKNAEAAGLNRSKYLKDISLKNKIKPMIPTIELDTYYQIGKIGNNINQIARVINNAHANIFHKETKNSLIHEFDDLKTIMRKHLDALKKHIK